MSREIKWRNARDETASCLCLDIVIPVTAFDIYIRERRTMNRLFENGEARLIKTSWWLDADNGAEGQRQRTRSSLEEALAANNYLYFT
jgi:hypothetical protein